MNNEATVTVITVQEQRYLGRRVLLILLHELYIVTFSFIRWIWRREKGY